MSEDFEGAIDWEEGEAFIDDGRWAYIAFSHPFSWQWFLNWWIARRYVIPRDVRRR